MFFANLVILEDLNMRDIKYLTPQSSEWYDLNPEIKGITEDQKMQIEEKIESDEKRLKDFLTSSLQMQNLMVLAGSGTSISDDIHGPSMGALWKCIESLPVKRNNKEITLKRYDIAQKINYKGDENIEEFLTQCEAFFQIYDDEDIKDVKDFYNRSREIILDKCSFDVSEDKLIAHKTFLYKLARRRARDSRLKLFTTNYDLCFEKAASYLGLIVIDGFSFTLPRQFDPRYFNYDIVRRVSGDEKDSYVAGVFHLYKLHGSVNWARDNNEIIMKDRPRAEEACIIYPAKGKYQQSYNQPYFECMARYLASLREPNTCIIVIGFGFNDDHLVKPLLSAIDSNPHLRLIVVNNKAKEILDGDTVNEHWSYMKKLSNQGYDIWFINSTFNEFAKVIPDLKALTPAEQLYQNIRSIVGE